MKNGHEYNVVKIASASVPAKVSIRLSVRAALASAEERLGFRLAAATEPSAVALSAPNSVSHQFRMVYVHCWYLSGVMQSGACELRLSWSRVDESGACVLRAAGRT